MKKGRNFTEYPLFRNLGQAYIYDYGEDLESKYDKADKTLYNTRIFCRDCPRWWKTTAKGYRPCKGLRKWKTCEIRKEALEEIRKAKEEEEWEK